MTAGTGTCLNGAVSQLDLTQEGHKGHEDKSFEQEERETAEVKIKKRSLVEPRSGGNSIA
jgi:hypothetical protein